MDTRGSAPSDASRDAGSILIGLTGKAGHGKSTVADIICDLLPGAVQYSLAGPVKTMALAIDPAIDVFVQRSGELWDPMRLSDFVNGVGWDVAKQDPEVRRFLQRLGTDGARATFGDDVWVNLMREWWDTSSTPVGVIPDVRFPNELAAVDVSIEVYRPDGVHLTGENAQHASETGALTCDYTVVNRGSLNDLRQHVAYKLVDMGLLNHAVL